jgi:hypothetical protein
MPLLCLLEVGLSGRFTVYVRSAALGRDDYVESIMGRLSRLLSFCAD